MSTLFRTKSIDDLIASSEEPDRRLKKTLGPWSLAFLGATVHIVGSLGLGSGLFTRGALQLLTFFWIGNFLSIHSIFIPANFAISFFNP